MAQKNTGVQVTENVKGNGKRDGKREKGYLEEQRAAEYLTQKGYQILERNFYSRQGEIDIIARDGKYLVFVEVKYRKNDSGGHPLEAVDIRKQKRICRTADWFCCRHGYHEGIPCRFDVIGIMGEEIVHVKDAFYYIR